MKKEPNTRVFAIGPRFSHNLKKLYGDRFMKRMIDSAWGVLYEKSSRKMFEKVMFDTNSGVFMKHTFS